CDQTRLGRPTPCLGAVDGHPARYLGGVRGAAVAAVSGALRSAGAGRPDRHDGAAGRGHQLDDGRARGPLPRGGDRGVGAALRRRRVGTALAHHTCRSPGDDLLARGAVMLEQTIFQTIVVLFGALATPAAALV